MKPFLLLCLVLTALIIPARLSSGQVPDEAQALHKLGVECKTSGRYLEAESALQRCLKIRETKLGAEHPDTLSTLGELADVYRGLGQSARAIPLYRQILKARESTLAADHLDVGAALNHLAETMMEAGQRRDVVPLLERGLKIYEAKLPADHADLVRSLNNLAVAYTNSGVNGGRERAVVLLRRALKILEAKHGENHAQVGVQLVNLAATLEGNSRSKNQQTWAAFPADGPSGTQGLLLLQPPADPKANRAEAAQLYARALKILEKTSAENDPNIAECVERLGSFHADEGKYQEAEPLLRRCVRIRKAVLPGGHPQLIQSLESLLRVQAAREQWQEASDLLDAINRQMRLHVRYNLPALSTPQQLAYLRRTHEPAFHRCLTLQFLRPDDRALTARSAEWVLNGKAVAHQARADQAVLVRDSKDPQAPEMARQLYAIRAELADLYRRGSQIADVAVKQRLAQLEQQEGQLAARLDLGGLRPDRGDPWVKLDDVRARIPADAVLIEIVDFDLWDFKKNNWKAIPGDEEVLKKLTDLEKTQSCYGAWIIPPAGKGDVRFVVLDNRGLYAAIDEYQKAMKAAPRQIQIDEGDAEEIVRKPLNAIASRCLKPLETHLAGTPRWLISPDNHLWLVPWAALPLEDGSYAIEKHTISYLSSGRDLLAAASKIEPGPALVLGDPDFDLGADVAQREVIQLLPKDRLTVRGPARELTEKVPRDWQRLFGTADEIKAVTPKLAAYTKQTPRVYTGERALESLVKAARSPRVLLLSTHGFTLPTPLPPLPEADGGDRITGRKINLLMDNLTPIETSGDAMARCGLVLAGANKRAKDADPSADDGILTGVEVLGCDLRGTELVVLSACETGLGAVNLGEGVAGLRQAFQLAGARSVVASLWKVSDQESAKLMASFWDNLAAGQGKAEALRNAQLALIKERRGKEKAAHPFFWAAFTLTGEWQ